MTKNSDLDAILKEKLRRLAEERAARGPISDWSQRDFVFLSEQIESQTKEQISVTTLKRVFGKVEYKGLPYIHTLNILAQFVGFSHWAAFRQATLQELGIEPKETEKELRPLDAISFTTEKSPNPQNEKTKFNLFLLWTVTVLAFFALGWHLGWWFEKGRWISDNTRNNLESPGKLTIETGNVDTLPMPVRILFQGPQGNEDDLTVINIGGNMRYFQINSSGFGSINHQFETSGIFPIRIFNNRRQLGYLSYLIPNKTWVATVFKGKIRKEIGSVEGLPYMHVSGISKKALGFDTMMHHRTQLVRYKEFGMSGDSLTFTTQIKNPQVLPELKNQHTQLILHCANNSIKVEFSTIMPRYGFFMQVGEVYLNKENLPSPQNFVQPFDNWRKLKVQTGQNTCKVWLDNTLLLNQKYTLPLGDLYGIQYQFDGSGWVDHFQLGDKRGKIWEEKFGNSTTGL